MSKQTAIQDLMNFLENSPSPLHAVNCIINKLTEHHFEILNEGSSWQLQPGKKYLLNRNGSVCAFVLPTEEPQKVNLLAAHTDSPGFKLKPHSEFLKENMVMLGIEVYGGPIINSWLNRDLGIAGQVVYKNKKQQLQTSLVQLEEFPVVLPQLAIHLDKEVNEKGVVLNKQEHLAVLASIIIEPKRDKENYLIGLLQKKLNSTNILSHDLFLYPLEKPKEVGGKDQLLASYRLDNLASVHSALTGLIESNVPHQQTLKMVCFWDHEEIGSHTRQGAGSTFFSHTLERICLALNLSREEYLRLIHNSECVSIDMAHGMHPNYSEKAEARHPVLLGKGLVIKSNAQQRYATDASSAANVIDLCQKNGIPIQHFVSRGDIAAGTTIGPIHAYATGMSTVDIGCPQLSMHSCRELLACQDHLDMSKFCAVFLK